MKRHGKLSRWLGLGVAGVLLLGVLAEEAGCLPECHAASVVSCLCLCHQTAPSMASPDAWFDLPPVSPYLAVEQRPPRFFIPPDIFRPPAL